MHSQLVIGKIAYEEQCNSDQNLTELIKSNDSLNLTTSNVKRLYGGKGGNIAYGLSLLGYSPILVSLVGEEFQWDYLNHLKNNRIECKILREKGKLTARQLSITDKTGFVLTFNQPNAYRYLAEYSLTDFVPLDTLKTIKTAFIGTGQIEADQNFIDQLITINPKVIVIYSLDGNPNEITKWRLKQLLKNIVILVGTSDELKAIGKAMTTSYDKLIAEFNRLKYIIELQDRTRILIHSQKEVVKITEGPAELVKSESNWHDAFISGLLYGIDNKKTIEESTKIGSALASYAVEKDDYQSFSPSLEEVILRTYEITSKKKPI